MNEYIVCFARMCLIITSAELAIKLFKQIPKTTNMNISLEMEQACYAIINKNSSEYMMLNNEYFSQAELITDYFFKQHLKINGFIINEQDNFEKIIQDVIN
jgi:hypothetical protein